MIHEQTDDPAFPVSRLILMSIKPQYWERIAAGDKRFELRKTRVRFRAGDVVVVYASAPHKALVGQFCIEHVHRAPVGEIWSRFRRHLGVGKADYAEYFEDATEATAIEIRWAEALPEVPLDELRTRLPGFRPPQSFMYWSTSHAHQILGDRELLAR